MILQYNNDSETPPKRKKQARFPDLPVQPMITRQMRTSKRLQEYINQKQKEQQSQEAYPKKQINLKALLSKNKVRNLVLNFAAKMKRMKTLHDPVGIQEQYHESNQVFKWLKKQEGVDLADSLTIIWVLINMFQLVAMAFIFSIQTSFPEEQTNETFLIFRVLSLVICILDMFFNLITQKIEEGKKVVHIWNIGQKYVSECFTVDLMIIVIYLMVIIFQKHLSPVALLLTIIKLYNTMGVFEKFEYILISTEKERYFGLVKVFITNFVIGHFLAVLLNLIVYIQTEEDSWHKIIGIENSEWFTKYIWGYYWGANIMLTVGFGDLKANNEIQAIFLIFIEIFSCIILAYNISNVGTIIEQIRSENSKKNQQLKTFRRMSKANEISEDLIQKVNNYIEQSYQIKSQFEFDNFDSLLEELPQSLQSEYRKESNNVLFDNIGFLSNMSKRTLMYLAEAVQRQIAHPGQTIRKKGTTHDFIIIQTGEVQLCCKNKSTKLTGQAFDSVKVKQNDKPKILSLQFIKGKSLDYDLVSSGYSILYSLNRQEFAKHLRKISMDFQFFCTIRDRDECFLGQNEIYDCEICKDEQHNKFSCPKLHYIPFRRLIIAKSLQQIFRNLQQRVKYKRIKNISASFFDPLKKIEFLNQETDDFCKKFMNEREYDQMNRAKKAYRRYATRIQIQKQSVITQRKARPSFFNHEGKLVFESQTLDANKQMNDFQSIAAETTNLISDNLVQKLEKMLLCKDNDKKEDWTEQVETAHNYRYYFIDYNIDHISVTYPKSEHTVQQSFSRTVNSNECSTVQALKLPEF